METTFVHGGTVFGALLVLIVGLVVGFLIGKNNPHLIDNTKRKLKEVKKERNEAMVKLMTIKNAVKDYPADLRKKIEELLEGNGDK